MCGWWSCFFFSSRRRHTRSLCDWSSDVCSSDLGGLGPTQDDVTREALAAVAGVPLERSDELVAEIRGFFERRRRVMADRNLRQADQIGRGACRGRGEISGGAGALKKKKTKKSRT